MGFLLVCMKVTLAEWQKTQVIAIASEALKKKKAQAALYAITRQSHMKPNLIHNYSHVRLCVQQLSYKTTTTTMPETLMLF